jgi:hypothetical protein
MVFAGVFGFAAGAVLRRARIRAESNAPRLPGFDAAMKMTQGNLL